MKTRHFTTFGKDGQAELFEPGGGENVGQFLANIVLSQLDAIDALKLTEHHSPTGHVGGGGGGDSGSDKIVHEKYGAMLAESSSNLSDLIGIHYLKTMWTLGIDTESIFDEYYAQLCQVTVASPSAHFELLIKIVNQDKLPLNIKNKVIGLLIVTIIRNTSRSLRLIDLLLTSHDEDVYVTRIVQPLCQLFSTTFADKTLYMDNTFVDALFECDNDVPITYAQVATIICYYVELMSVRPVKEQQVLHVSGVDGTVSQLDWNVLKGSGQTNCDCIAIHQENDCIKWVDSLGYSGLVDEGYVHSCKRFTELTTIDWVKAINTGAELSHFIIKSGERLWYRDQQGNQQQLDINASRVSHVHCFNTMVILQLVEQEFIYFYHAQPIAKNSRIELFKLSDRIAQVIGTSIQVKEIILYHDEHSDWPDLKMGFGAILTTGGKLIEFTQLFSSSINHALLLTGIEHIYRDPKSRQYYFIQSFGGSLYTIETSVDLIDRVQSLKQVDIRHTKSDNDHTNVPMSNKYVKQLSFGPADTAERRVTILTRENKLIRCQVESNGAELSYPYYVNLKLAEERETFQLTHCSTGSYYISTSATVITDSIEQIALLSRIIHLSAPFHTDSYGGEATQMDRCIYATLRALQYSLSDARTADLVSLMDSLWQLECTNDEVLNASASVWLELITRDSYKLMRKVVTQIRSLPSESHLNAGQQYKETLLIRVCISLLDSIKNNVEPVNAESLNIVWLFMLQYLQRFPLQHENTKITELSVVSSALITSIGNVLDSLTTNVASLDTLFQVVTDSFCHFADIIEAAVYQAKTLSTLSFFVMSNQIYQIFINLPVQHNPFEQSSNSEASLVTFFTKVVKFFKRTMLADLTASDMVNVLFNELMESIQKLFATVALLEQTQRNYNSSREHYTLTKEHLLPPNRPQLVLECEVGAARHALKIGDFVIDLNNVNEAKRQSLLDQYHNNQAAYVSDEDRELLADQKTFILLPDSLRKHVNSVGAIVAVINQAECGANRTAELLALFSGTIRSVVEGAFCQLEQSPYLFIQQMKLKNVNNKPDNQLINRILAPYAGQSRPMLILLEKCIEVFVNISDCETINNPNTIRQNVAKIFTMMMKQHQESEGNELVNLCLSPLRKAELLCRYVITDTRKSRWMVKPSTNLAHVIEKRVRRKQLLKFNNEIVSLILDEQVTTKGMEKYLTERDIFVTLLYRCARLPVHFRQLPTKTKVAYMHGWLAQRKTSVSATLYTSCVFSELRNRHIREVEVFAEVLCQSMQTVAYQPWHDIHVELASLITFMTTAINVNIGMFDATALPYYIINTLQRLILHATKHVYFDPVLYYTQSNALMQKAFGAEMTTVSFESYTLGRRVIRRHLLQRSAPLFRENNNVGTIVARDEDDDDGVVVTVRWDDAGDLNPSRETHHPVSDLTILEDYEPVEMVRGARDDADGGKVEFDAFDQNPLQIFLVYMIKVLAQQKQHTAPHALVPIVLHAANKNDFNFSTLNLIKSSAVADQVFRDIFPQVKTRVLARSATNGDVFTNIQWLRFLMRSSSHDHLIELFKLLGRLIVIHVKSQLERENARVELSLTYAINMRQALRDAPCDRILATLINQIVAEKSLNLEEAHLAALFVLGSINLDQTYIVGAFDDNNNEIIVKGPKSALSLKVTPDTIELVTARGKTKVDDEFEAKSTHLMLACVRFTMSKFDETTVANATISAGPLQLKKMDKKVSINQFAKYMMIRTKFVLAGSARLITQCAKHLESQTDEQIELFINNAFKSQPIRHTIDRNELLGQWMKQILSGRGTLHDNNVKSFSASLFATSLHAAPLERNPSAKKRRKPRPKTSGCPESLLVQISEMGFPGKLVKRAFTALIQEGADSAEINSNMLVERIIDLQHGDELLFFEEDDPSSDSDTDTDDSNGELSDGEVHFEMPERVRPRSDFGDLPFEYEVYVRDNVRPGSCVILLKQQQQIRERSIGKVREVNRSNSLRSESIQVEFYRNVENSASFYPSLIWVKPCDLELVDHGMSPVEERSESTTKIAVGQSVSVRPCVAVPVYGWGGIGHDASGQVRDILDTDIIVDFPNHAGWRGRLDEMEPSATARRIVTDADRIITHRTSSSNADKLFHLFDGNCDMASGTYWKSSRADQADDEIWVELTIKPGSVINHVKMRVDYRDQSFMPTHIGVYVRENTVAKATKVKEVNIRETTTFNKAIVLLGKQEKHYSLVRLRINTMLQGGNDCKIRAIEVSASHPPLKLRTSTQWPSSCTYDQSEKCNIYVWGLNDSDQILKRHGRIFDPLLSRQLTALHPKSVAMSAKGTLILTLSGTVFVIGDLAPKPASASGAELRQACRECGDPNLAMIKLSAHCTGRHWLGLDRYGGVWVSHDAFVRRIMTNALAISAGYEYSLVVDHNGHVYGWGSNQNGRILATDVELYQTPVRIPIEAEICSVTAGSLTGKSLALDRLGNVYQWGGSLSPSKITLSESPIKQLASGADFNAALDDRGKIITWGRRCSGRLGHAAPDDAPRPIDADSSVIFTHVVCGALHCMAIDANGSLWTWGDNSHGQLGQEQTMIKSPQIIIKGLTNIAGIAAGSGHACYWEHCFVKANGSRQINMNTGETTLFGSVSNTATRSDLVDALEPGAVEPLDSTLPLKEDQLNLAFTHMISMSIVVEFIIKNMNDEKFFNVGWDLAKMMIFKRVSLNRQLFSRLWIMLDQTPRLLWTKLLADYESVSTGFVPISKNTSSQPIMSSHPYKNDQKIEHFWRNPAASSVQMTFDLNCHVEQNHDYLRVRNFNRTLMDLTGKFGPRQSIDMPVNFLHYSFESDAKVAFWGYEISLRPQYELDLAVRLSNDELLNLPYFTFYRYMLTEEIMNGLPSGLSHQLTKQVQLCIMKSSLISSADALWMFELATKLLQRHYIHVDGFEQKVKHFLSELIQFETDDVKAERKLQFSETIRLLMKLCHTFSSPPHWTIFSGADNRHIETSDLFELYDILADEIPKSFLARVRRQVKKVYDVELESDINLTLDTLINEQISQWVAEEPTRWWQVNQANWNSKVFMCGYNNRGQLGSTKNDFGVDSLYDVTPLPLSKDLTVSQIILGQQSMFAIMNNGDVWSSGEGANGRLGYPAPENDEAVQLRKVEHISHPVTALSTHPNGKHVLALTFMGVVYSWGDSEFGQTGHGTRDTVEKARLVQALRGVEVVKVAAGARHSACIDTRGYLFTWGCGRHGKLGHPIANGTNHADVTRPKRVMHFQHLNVVDVACGDGDGHTVALTKGESGANVWSWGRQGAILGRHCPSESPAHLPGHVPFHKDVQIKNVYAGANFSVVLSEIGEVFTWGKGGYYRLGHGDEENAFAPLKVNTFEEKVKTVAVGALHTICVTETNAIIGWGDNERGQLAHDQYNKLVKQPQLLHQFDNDKNIAISAGSAHTALLERNFVNRHKWPIPEPIPIKYTTLENLSHQDICTRRQMLLELGKQIVKNYQLLDMTALFALSGSIAFSIKENLLRRLLMSTMWGDVKHGPTIQINRVVKEPTDASSPNWMGSVTWQVIHEVLFDESNLQAFKLNGRCWKIRFIGESVDDCGGGYSDSIAEICQEMQCAQMALPLLTCTPNTAEHEETSREFVVKPVTRSTTHNEQQLYVFLGLLIGSAIRQGSPLSLRMDRSMWKLLRGERLNVNDVFGMDDSLKQKIEFVRANTDAEVEIEGTIRTVCGETLVIVDGVITETNKNEFVSKALEFKLNEFNSAITIIRENIIKVVQLPLLSMFTPDELNTLVTGEVDIPIDLLKKVTVYKGIKPDSEYAAWFWEILSDFTCKERQLFLRFVWGRTRLPRTVADFRGRDFVLQGLGINTDLCF